MSDTPPNAIHDESLSALMDGEAQELELRRLLQQLPGDPALRARWARYQLASSLMHKQPHIPEVSFSLADAVQAAIQQDEDAKQDAHSKVRNGSLLHKTAGRFAVAASVALAVVAGVQWQQQGAGAVGQLATATSAPAINSVQSANVESATVPLLVSQPLVDSPFMPTRDAQNARYMQYNLERASLDAGKSMVPLAPVADQKK